MQQCHAYYVDNYLGKRVGWAQTFSSGAICWENAEVTEGVVGEGAGRVQLGAIK